MRDKLGIGLKDLASQMVLAAIIVRDCYAARDPSCLCVVTRVNDGKGNTLNFETDDYHGDVEKLASDIQFALGHDFHVVMEDLHEVNEHIHVEYNPK